MKPKSLIELTNALNALPGVSKKNSERIAFYLVSNQDTIGNELANTIREAGNNLSNCKTCNHLSELGKCNICEDKTRQKTLVIVETPMDIFKFEENTDFRPFYHVLGGLINISKKIEINDLFIDTLQERAKGMNEIILALSPNLEGIVTANYIKELLYDYKVTQLAQGIPLGAAMEYVDELTLRAAIKNRKEVK